MAKKRKPPKKPVKQSVIDLSLKALYQQVREILDSARNQAWRAVNAAMVESYWEVGRVVVEKEQAGKERADYGKG